MYSQPHRPVTAPARRSELRLFCGQQIPQSRGGGRFPAPGRSGAVSGAGRHYAGPLNVALRLQDRRAAHTQSRPNSWPQRGLAGPGHRAAQSAAGRIRSRLPRQSAGRLRPADTCLRPATGLHACLATAAHTRARSPDRDNAGHRSQARHARRSRTRQPHTRCPRMRARRMGHRTRRRRVHDPCHHDPCRQDHGSQPDGSRDHGSRHPRNRGRRRSRRRCSAPARYPASGRSPAAGS